MEDAQRLDQLELTLEELSAALAGTGLDGRAREAAGMLAQFRAGYYDFREICDYLYDGIHISDGEGRVLFVNKAYTRITGLRPEDVVGRRVQDIEAEGVLYRGSVTGAVIRERRQVSSVATIFKVNKEMLITGTPIFDEAGNMRLVVCNTRDFPELKRMEQRLQDLKEESDKANEELAYLRSRQAEGRGLVYRSAAMEAVMELVGTVAQTDVTILITGESGTGKELIANEIYQRSGRKGKPFIKVNCAAIPAELLESELFGYEAGAFTGAKSSGKAGMFELADTGVILLDEIGDMPLPLQTKLLRVLQERELMRIGGARPVKLNLRVIAATNKDLKEEVCRGNFREDLYYRLNVVPVELRPLRERKEDIPLLAAEFCRSLSKRYGKEAVLTPGGVELLMEYHWPGNIRELENLVERLVVTNAAGPISRGAVFRALNPGGVPFPAAAEGQTLKSQVHAFEREIILHALAQEGSLRRAAKVLGVDHSTLVKKCGQYRCGPSGENFQHDGE